MNYGAIPTTKHFPLYDCRGLGETTIGLIATALLGQWNFPWTTETSDLSYLHV